MSKHSYHHGDLRNALLDGAYDMLMEEGIQNLSLRKVAKRVGVSHNAPYQHFSDKEALIAAVAEQGFAHLSKTIHHLLEQHHATPSIDKLILAAQAYVQFMAENPAYLEVMFGPYHHSDYPDLSKTALATFELLVSIVIEGQVSGEIKQGDAREIAATIWMTLHGISTIFRDGKLPSYIVNDQLSTQLAGKFLGIICEGIRANERSG